MCPSPTLVKQNYLNYTKLCDDQKSCHSCLHNTYACIWCAGICSHQKCADHAKVRKCLLLVIDELYGSLCVRVCYVMHFNVN